MCTLLQYFCDCELRHRVEAIAAFSDEFVTQIQTNQRQRYNELMMAFTMSAAETARKTREFRSPPQEQVRKPYMNLQLQLSSHANRKSSKYGLDFLSLNTYFKSDLSIVFEPPGFKHCIKWHLHTLYKIFSHCLT